MEKKSFKDSFREVAAFWPSKSGKSLSGKLREPIPKDLFLLLVVDSNPKEGHPKARLFVHQSALPGPDSLEAEKDVPF